MICYTLLLFILFVILKRPGAGNRYLRCTPSYYPVLHIRPTAQWYAHGGEFRVSPKTLLLAYALTAVVLCRESKGYKYIVHTLWATTLLISRKEHYFNYVANERTSYITHHKSNV
jgi:hypothetical protein